MKKIAVVDPSSYVIPYDYYYLTELSKSYQIDFYCSVTEYNQQYIDTMKKNPYIDVKEFQISGINRVTGVFNYMKMLMSIFRCQNHYDKIHFQWSILYGVFFVIEWLFFLSVRKKLIFTFHNPVPHHIEKKTYWPFRIIAKLASKVIFLSDYTRDTFLNNYKININFMVSQIGLHPLALNDKPEIKEKISPEKTIIFWGNVKPYKGVDLLLKMKQSGLFKDYQFEIYGKWDLSLRKIKKELIEANVTVIDNYLPIEELKQLMSRDALFILPYKGASQSAVLYTLLVYNRIIVSSKAGENYNFMLKHNLNNLLFDRDDLLSVKQAVDYATIHYLEIMQRMSEIRKEYEWETVLKNADDIYQ